jgi:hypothetical protein
MSMENHSGMMPTEETPDSSTRELALWQSYQQSNLVACRRNGKNEQEFGLAKYFCS